MPAHLQKLRPLFMLTVWLVGESALLAQTNNSWALATTAPTNANWFSVAIAPTNSLMVAVVHSGGIYTATNSGNIWKKTSAQNLNWSSVAASADGRRLAAVVLPNGGIYTSINSGISWRKTGAPDINWASVASSFDGKKLAAAATGNWIYTSTDSGTNWHNNPSAPNTAWNTIATSADGNRLVAVVFGGGVYASTNAGSSWKQQTNAPANTPWSCVASSADGTNLVAGVKGGGIYTSTNAGKSWVKTSAPDTNWLSIASSKTGHVLLAGVGYGGGIYVSTNSGGTWEETGAPIANWYSVATSLSGSKFIGAVYGGGIYSWQMPIFQEETVQEDTPTTLHLTSGHLDGTNFTYAIVSNPTNGNLGVLNTNTGAVTYTSVTNFNGEDGFSFRVYDGSFYSTGTVSITVEAVNDAPVAHNQTTNTLEDVAVEVKLIATDIEGDTLTYDIATEPTNGIVSVPDVNGEVTYTPDENYNGLDSFTFTAYDGELYATGRVTITVKAVNDAPVADDQDITLDEDSSTNLVLTATDIDSTNLTYSIVSNPTNGNLGVLNTNTGAVTYTSVTNFNGEDAFTFRVYDGSFYSTGTVSITVEPVNDAPVAVDQDIVALDVAATHLVLTATDVDGDSLTYAIDSLPEFGSLSGFDPDTGAVTYTPNANYYGADSFTFIASDGEFDSIGFVNIMVVAAPLVTSQTIRMLEDSATNLVLTATDADSLVVTYAIAQLPAHGSLSVIDPDTGAVTYSPTANYRGADSFKFTASDGALYATGTVSITITAATNWHSVAMTSAGDLMAVVDFGGGIYTSTNYGSTWKKTSAPDRNWVSVVASFEGDLLAAAAQGDGIYTSTDRGSSWVKTSAPNTNWVAMVTSFNGVKLVAASRGDGIYTSTDAGINWLKTSAPALNWSALAGTFPGGTLGATAYGSGIYFSTDSGAHWDLSLGTDTEGFDNWSCLALAANFNAVQLVAAGIAGGGIYNAPDFESTPFLSSAPDVNWRGIAASETGAFLVAASEGGIYTSTDSGDFWNLTAAPNADWHSVATSFDGTKYVAVAYGGAIYNWEVATRLNLEHLPGTLRFSWANTAASTGFVLQQNTGFNPANWVNVDGNLYPTYNSLNLIVQDLPLPATNTFYRLKR